MNENKLKNYYRGNYFVLKKFIYNEFFEDFY